MSITSHDRILPLHLAPFEEFMRLDDRPTHPMTFVIQMDVTGTINRAAFEEALDEAQARHPLLGALLQPGKRNLLCWVPADNPRPAIDWAGVEVPLQCPRGEGVDLSGEVGLRIWVRQGDGRGQITLQFHHACCDGIGAYRFIGDLCAAYGIRTATGGKLPVMGPIKPQLLRQRRQKTLNVAWSGTPYQAIRLALGQGVKLLGRRVSPLNPPQRPSGQQPQLAAFPGIQSFTFERPEHDRLRAAVGKDSATVNDLLLNDLFHTMHQWNERHRSWRRTRWLRIMMPTDLRSQDDYEMPAANMASYTFLTRRASDCRDPKKLLRSIYEETTAIKYGRLGTLFMDMIAVAEYVPWLLRRLLRSGRCLATAILSNVGDPSRRFSATFPRDAGRVVFGDLRLEDITGVPPLRHKTRAAISVFTYQRKLTLSLRCDPHLFTVDDTRELLSLYVERLRQTASP